MEQPWNRGWIQGIQDRRERVESSGYDEAGGRCSLGSLILRRNHGVGMRRTGALQEEIKGSRAGASKYKPRIRWIRWARASSYSLGRRTVNRYKRVSALIVPTNFFSRSLIDLSYWLIKRILLILTLSFKTACSFDE